MTACSFSANAQYTEVVIPDTSELIFADALISLNVRTIRVFGALRIGSPTCRFYSPITITFFGSRAEAGWPTLQTKSAASLSFPFPPFPSTPVSPYVSTSLFLLSLTFLLSEFSLLGSDGKGIVVDASGTIEMFGKLYHPTWTRLAAPVIRNAVFCFCWNFEFLLPFSIGSSRR